MKCALKKRCKNQELFDQIQEDVREMSALAVEASRYCHFDLMRHFEQNIFPTQKIDFSFYFRALLTQNPGWLDPAYSQIRGNLRFYSNECRSNIMVDLISQYETAFKNNLKVHGYSRMRKFFKTCVMYDENGEIVPIEDPAIRDTLAFLFNRESDALPDQGLLLVLRLDLHWTGEKLIDIDSAQYFKHVEIFYRLQRFNEINLMKNFMLIPQHHFGSVHIRYDTQAMFYVLDRLKLIEPPEGEKMTQIQFRNYVQQNEEVRKKMWFSFFKTPETRNKKFNFSLQTDGVAVSFSMNNKNKDTHKWTDDGLTYGIFLFTQIHYSVFLHKWFSLCNK